SSVYFYDERGSQIFEQICDLEEYYLTRKETEILKRSARTIIGGMPDNTHLIELGSGSSTKTRILLEAALGQFELTRYSPIDISAEMLAKSAKALTKRFPRLQVEALAGRYEAGRAHFLKQDDTPNCIMWLGSSIGNLTRQEATSFLSEIHQNIDPRDSLLLGIDLRKDADILEPAYDDAAGVTAAFNLNLLVRINTELSGQFQLDQFHHQAVYNDVEGRIEMYLVSDRDQEVCIRDLDTSITFKKNEKILTEYSYKYSRSELETLTELSGFQLTKQWLDDQGWFSLNFLKPKDSVV
ncbi:MAG: L-histidine N(alpha)-methyltransferase, partial [Candidatus Marinimicrobia bacterium]|nr:L-histidine N(alpha)-methyltransferase [Candidatus Neomarinimicrobiota bacterium]